MGNGAGITQVDSTKVFLDILDEQGGIVRSIESTTSDFLYTASEQINDLGIIQTSLSFNIAQESSFLGRGRVLSVRNLTPKQFI